ncbi:hypothetical protein CT694_33585 (plasmid) [Bacillus wiedmannii bv. thuringiensis]|nr:hypothetical protein CT694_33585 [Bacillus wiedmannii bv. thuringiensis]
MNSYQNKNEFEILDVSSENKHIFDRYPLKNKQNRGNLNMDYKDWIVMCETQNGYEPFDVNAPTAVSTLLLTTGTILSLAFPITGAAGIVLGTILPLLWPADSQDVWEKFMNHAVQISNKNLTDAIRITATDRLKGLQNTINLYKKALQDWDHNRDSPQAKERVRDQFRTVNNLFEAYMPTFESENYEIPLLSVYASAANLHLLHLRDSYIHGIKWGYSQKEVDDNYELQLSNTEKYVDHCVLYYNKGLNDLKSNPNTDWNTFNDYRREMTIAVLDIISLFSSYDVKTYYNMGIKSELTREVYTKGLNLDVIEVRRPIAETENLLTRPPHLFTWLNKFEFDTNSNYSPNWYFLAGHRNFYTTTNSSTIEGSSGYGQWGYPGNTRITRDIPKYIYRVTTKSYVKQPTDTPNINQINFSLIDNTSVVYNAGTGNRELRTTVFELPSRSGAPIPTYTNYSHILSYMKSYNNLDRLQANAFAWTHYSVDRLNTIVEDKITQIPAVKANYSFGSNVVKGPGHTGGDLIKLENIEVTCKLSARETRNYKIRLRYAANKDVRVRIQLFNVPNVEFNVKGTFSGVDYANLKYAQFDYVEIPVTMVAVTEQRIGLMNLSTDLSAVMLIDKIEFIPITQSLLDYTQKQNLEKVQKVVNTLFIDDTNGYLQMDTTDYDIDQAANLVECISDELYAKEKMVLLDKVKYAKQLSKSRNLLLNGDFESLDRFGKNGWTTSDNISIQADNPIFKGNYLKMFGARDIDGSIFPTYIYQKVDESRLKPYTRYKVRGFVGSSEDLELLVTRYDEKIDAIMNIYDDLATGKFVNSCGELHRCNLNTTYLEERRVNCPLNTLDYNQEQSNLDNKLKVSQYSCSNYSHESNKECQDLHPFSFHIDIGELDTNTNLGIWVLFKISNPDGYATLGNLEVIEERPLTGEALAHVKHKEKKWNQQMEKKRMETKQAYDPAKQVVDALFTNAQREELQYNTTLDHIKNADRLVQSIPYVYHDWLPNAPGMNYDVYQGLNASIMQARYLYDARNVIQNGDFTQGLMGWHATANVDVQQMDGDSVLVLSNWSAGVSQNLHAEDHHGYVLRVIAKKEGPGKGYVTMMDCNGKQETLTFTSCEEGYITKNVEVFPESDRVRIEIGETEGTFYIDSIEFLCMKGYNSNYSQNTSDMYNQGYNR